DALEATYQSAPVGLCVLDADLRFVRINARLAEINGRPVEAHRGRTIAEVVPGVAAAAEPMLRRVLATGEPVIGLELSGETPAAPGVHRTWVESWYPLRDAAGGVVGVNIVADDVTDRRHTEMARRASDARYRALVEAAPLIAWSGRDDGTIDLANQRWTEYTGRSPADTIGSYWADVVHPDDRARVRTLREYAIATEEPIEIEARFRRHDGAYRWHVARVVPVRVGPAAAAARHADHATSASARTIDPIVAWYGAALDIEDRKREAAELAQTVGELKRANAELARVTDDLRTTNEELEAANVEARAARVVAEHANDAKTQFLATMSHELRTPLNAVLGYVDLLELELAGPLTTDQRAYLDRVTTSARHLLGLINEVLDLAKVEAGQMSVALQPTVVRGHVLDAATLVRPQAERKGLVLAVDPPEAAGLRVLADPDRLRQVLVNLLGNAVKFTPSGGRVAVHVAASAGAAPPHGVDGRAFARIDVEDTGIGIPADQLDAVFEPFVQVEVADADRPVSVYTRRHGGTGLGLTIARRLARLMGGDLTLESTPGRGSRFSVWLPLAPAPRLTPAWTPTVRDPAIR
ncbi:MAG TPA: PAS domain-containing protein, partial [Gemmatirosa sp.]